MERGDEKSFETEMIQDTNLISELTARFCALKPTEKPSAWVERNVRFDEPKIKGPFSFSGREFLREVIDDWGNQSATDFVNVFGTGVGKTIAAMAGKAWRIAFDPMRCLSVMPTTHGPGGARNFCKSRLQKMFEATECLREWIPTGAKRHDYAGLHISLNGSIIDFAGSNSPGQLAANRCDVVEQDEVDKFNEGTAREAAASYLADERTKGVPGAKRFKYSSPTLTSGVIWTEFLKSDQQRRFVPCPHCSKFVVFAWSKQFTIFPELGCEAFIRWDAAAKINGVWDLERVVKTAHLVCPHCAGKILDSHKFAMDKLGEWRATAKGSPGYRGRHLPSLYSTSPECSFGQMAKKFLLSKRSITGLRGFINSDLAEPFESQDVSIRRSEKIVKAAGAGGVALLTVDCQQKAPYFWYAVRIWHPKESCAAAAGSCDTWEDLEALQEKFKIPNDGVMLDSGFGAKDEAEVYRNCARHGEIFDARQGGKVILGWVPAKGFPSRRRWRNEADGTSRPYRFQPIDPFMGTSEAGKFKIELFEFSADYFKDILATAREGGKWFEWRVEEAVATPEYWKHMDGQVKQERYSRLSGATSWKWEKRHTRWPDHILSCEVLQFAFALSLQIIELEEKEK